MRDRRVAALAPACAMVLSLFAVTGTGIVFGACSKPSAAQDSARAAPAAAASRDEDDPPGEAPGAVPIPAAQLARLRVAPVALSNFRPTMQVTGSVQFNADVSTQVLSPVSGPVTRILAEPGAEVHRGQALALVSSPDFAGAVAEFRKTQAAWVQAKRVADLDAQLWKNDAIARRDLEQAQTDAVAAEADRDAALQQLRSLGLDEASIAALRDGTGTPDFQAAIRAPIAGTVVERLINPGQLLEAGSTPAYTIADLSSMWVQANVFESELRSVQVGDRADIVTPASPTPLVGRVTYIAALVDPSTRATAVRVLVANTRRVLRKDMYVQVTIHATRERTGILVPVTSVLRDDDNLPFVFVEAPGNRGASFARRHVTLGSRVGDRYEVTAGLQPGERIISEGGLFVQFAQSQ